MVWRISAVTFRDFMRLHEVSIAPESDSSLILIDGNNRQGKTSVLTAFATALAGKRAQPPDPVRHGADRAELLLELQDPNEGTLRVERSIKPDGSMSVKLTNASGQLGAPQKVLDAIIGARFMDPIAFLTLKPTEQREMLFKIIDADGKLAKLEVRRDEVYKARTEIGRDLEKAKGELGRLPPTAEVPSRVDVAAAAEERTRIAEVRRSFDAFEAATKASLVARQTSERSVAATRRKIEMGEAEIAKVERQLAELRATLAADRTSLEAELDEMEVLFSRHSEKAAELEKARVEWDVHARRLLVIESELKNADSVNRRAIEAELHNRRRSEADDTVKRMLTEQAAHTENIERLDRRRTQILQEAKLPVDGLGYSETGLVLNGVPFEQASGAERFRVALGIAGAASPNLADVWIRDGAILDHEQLAILGKHCEERGLRAWVERVGKLDDGAIVIEDGRVLE